jgi:hypothetical protein
MFISSEARVARRRQRPSSGFCRSRQQRGGCGSHGNRRNRGRRGVLARLGHDCPRDVNEVVARKIQLLWPLSLTAQFANAAAHEGRAAFFLESPAPCAGARSRAADERFRPPDPHRQAGSPPAVTPFPKSHAQCIGVSRIGKSSANCPFELSLFSRIRHLRSCHCGRVHMLCESRFKPRIYRASQRSARQVLQCKRTLIFSVAMRGIQKFLAALPSNWALSSNGR